MVNKYVGPIFGPESFQVVKTNIEETELRLPSFNEMVSLMHNAFQKANSKYYKRLIRLFEEHSFWTNTGVLYTTKGIYIQNNPQIELDKLRKAKRVLMDQRELEKRLTINDSNVSFLKYGSYNEGHLDTSKLKRHKLILSLMRGSPVKELEYIAGIYEKKFRDFQNSTYLCGLDELPKTFEGESQTRLVGIGCWNNDLGTPSGLHIHTLIDESNDELEIHKTKRMRYRGGYKGRYGVGIV